MPDAHSSPVGRFAPSPTGFLHLGNAWSFFLNWLIVKSRNGKILLRIDDIDPDRSKPEYIDAIYEDLTWLGLGWDAEMTRQSLNASAYANALDKLEQLDLVYPCFRTRKELRTLASAPHAGEVQPAYPGTCLNLDPALREKCLSAGRPFSLRLKCRQNTVQFYDLIQGLQIYAHNDYGGDFAIRRSDGVWSYQLATVVDDHLSGVNLVVRGSDLLESTAKQLIIAKYLGYPAPEYAHHPLLLDKEGERLAKRHKDLSIQDLRKKGVRPEQITGLLAHLAGLNPGNRPGNPADFTETLNYGIIPQKDIILSDSNFI